MVNLNWPLELVKRAFRKKEKNEIPKDLQEAVDYLKKHVSPENLARIKSVGDAEFDFDIVKDWGLLTQSNIRSYFLALGVFHPYFMANMIIETLRRELNGEPWDLEGQVRFYRSSEPKAPTAKPLGCRVIAEGEARSKPRRPSLFRVGEEGRWAKDRLRIF